MTTISLSATDALMDLMPGRAAPRKAAEAGAQHSGRPWSLRLLPQAWGEALNRRARQIELEAAFARLAETSPHLLADIGVAGVAEVAKPAPLWPWTRALPAPGALASRPLALVGLSRSRRRLMALDDRLLRDVGLTRAQARQEARRPVWDAPSAWLR